MIRISNLGVVVLGLAAALLSDANAQPPAEAPAAGQTGAAASAEKAPEAQAPLRKVQIEMAPSIDEFTRYYPARAQRLGLTGDVVIRCVVTDVGKLSQCQIIEETPANYGFGEASLKLASQFKLKPKTGDGTPVAGRIFQTKIRFALATQPRAR